MTQLKSAIVDGQPRLHFLEWNEAGRADVVLLHGSAANAWWWFFVVRHLPEKFRLIALDLRGHGDSDWVRPPAYEPFDHAEDVRRLVERLALRAPIIVGHSMGGLVALAFASRYPELVSGLAAVDVALVSTERRNRFLRRLKALPLVSYPDLVTAKQRFRLIPDEGEIPVDVLAFVAERSLEVSAEGQYLWKFDRETFFGADGLEPLATIAQIKCPILLVRGAKSRVMTSAACGMAAKINPMVRQVEVADAHHHVLLEQPSSLAKVLASFVDEIVK